MTPSAFLKAAPRGLSIATAAAFVILCSLGVWQIQRLHWKEGLIADMARTQALPPVPLADGLADARPAWRAVVAPPCATDPGHVLYMHSQAEGRPGNRVLIACPAPDGAILADLGFIAQDAKLGDLPPVLNLTGRLRALEPAGAMAPPNDPAASDWYWRSAVEMGGALKSPVRGDYFLVADLKASNLQVPSLEQGQLIAPLVNRHLEYALTWFGLAAALLAVFTGVVWQKAAKT